MDSSIIEALRSVIQEELHPVKEDLHQIREQLDRMEANQNEDVIAMLQHIDHKLTDFRQETQINFKSLSRRMTAVETDLSETMVEVEALKQKQPQR